MELVSVIIPTFNRAHLVVNAIISALEQTYQNIEVIVVDDGSNDKTEDSLKQFYGKIKYLKKENGGVSSARNYGTERSAGKLVAFLDSDDIWYPNKIEKQVEYLNKNPDFGMVLCDCNFVDEFGVKTAQSNRRSNLPVDGYILNDVIVNPSLIPSSVLVKKETLLQAGLFDEALKTAEDLDLHLKLSKITKIGLIAEPLFSFMRGHEGLSILSRTYDDHVQVVENFISKYGLEVTDNLKRKALFTVYYQATKGKLWHNEWQQSLKYFNKLIKYSSKSTINKITEIILLFIKIAVIRVIKPKHKKIRIS